MFEINTLALFLLPVNFQSHSIEASGTALAVSHRQQSREGIHMADEGNSAASSAIWAIALIIIVGLLALVVWKGGLLAPTDKKVDINVTAPSSR